MTQTQQDLTEGFRVSLLNRGFLLHLEGSSELFPALVQPIAAITSEFSLADNERETCRIHVHRENLPSEPITVGDYLIDDEHATRHRVGEIYDHPTQIQVIYTCDTVPEA